MRRVLAISICLAAVGGCSDDDSSATTTGAGTSCSSLALGMSPTGCPEAAVAEAAWTKVENTCGLAMGDVDFSTATSPAVTASGAAKLCASCECRQAAFDYYAQYKNCTGSDEGNTNLAKNVYGVANGC